MAVLIAVPQPEQAQAAYLKKTLTVVPNHFRWMLWNRKSQHQLFIVASETLALFEFRQNGSQTKLAPEKNNKI